MAFDIEAEITRLETVLAYLKQQRGGTRASSTATAAPSAAKGKRRGGTAKGDRGWGVAADLLNMGKIQKGSEDIRKTAKDAAKKAGFPDSKSWLASLRSGSATADDINAEVNAPVARKAARKKR